MDRRDFLKALAAIGAAGISARSLANASERTIARAWQRVVSEPRIFYVRAEYPYTLTTEPSYNAEVKEMVAAWGDDGAGISPMDSATGQGRAMTFFYLWEETGNFDIRLVDGECPGSSYFGAELCSSIEEANQSPSTWSCRSASPGRGFDRPLTREQPFHAGTVVLPSTTGGI